MKDKELLEKLNSLRNVNPDSTWKSENRSVLMNQIYGAQDSSDSKEFNLFKSFFKTLPRYAMDLAGQPTMVVVFIFMLVFGGSATSIRFSHNTKPGDSLYIAKLLSERTREVFTFNDKEKAQLVIKHARNRTEELNQVLSEPSYDGEKVEKLADDARREIDKARTRLEKINTAIAKQDNQDNNDGVNDNEVVAVAEQEASSEEEPQEVFSVNSGKDKNGMQVAEMKAGESVVLEEVVGQGDDEIEVGEALVAAEPTTLDILDEADDFLTDDNYNATLDKLVEANVAIDKSIIKEDPATSTEEVIIEDSDTASSTEE